MLSREQIEILVPHTGKMCLLDQVTHWDSRGLVCHARAPTADHPLARDGALSTVAAVEYAAQAAALHGALLEGATRPREGLLARLRDVTLAPGLLRGALTVRADLLSLAASGCLYGFVVHDAHIRCAEGRLMVMFQTLD